MSLFIYGGKLLLFTWVYVYCHGNNNIRNRHFRYRRASSVGNMLAGQVWGPRFDPQHHTKSQVWWDVLVISVLRSQRQVGPLHSLVRELSWISKPQANGSPCFMKTRWITFEEWIPRLTSGFHMQVYRHACTPPPHTHTPERDKDF